jgi:hypothetical protein
MKNWNPLRRCRHPLERRWIVRPLKLMGGKVYGYVTRCEDCGAEIIMGA